MTLSAESGHREFARRRQVYAEFPGAAEARILTERTGRGQADDDVLLQRSLGGGSRKARLMPPRRHNTSSTVCAGMRGRTN